MKDSRTRRKLHDHLAFEGHGGRMFAEAGLLKSDGSSRVSLAKMSTESSEEETDG